MNLYDRITEDMKAAMKAQNVELLATLRMLKSALQNQEIALGHGLTDVETMAILEKQAKQRRDSIEQYHAGNREDLADIEATELKIIEGYLPQKLGTEELTKLVDAAIATTGATTISDMGKVIKMVMEKAAGAADAKTISDIIKSKLA